MNFLEKNQIYLDEAISYYFSNDEQKKYFGKIPKSRYYTFKYCYNYFVNMKLYQPLIIELGTSRSFVDGRFEGCNSNNIKYWHPENPEFWDWSAGCFTKVFSNLFPEGTVQTVDIEKNHLERCKIMNQDRNNIIYNCMKSEQFLENFNGKADLIYLDTGDMTPIEDSAVLQLNEAKIIVECNLLKDNGLILIDDVKSVVPKQHGEISDLGKAKYSLPYLLKNGYHIVLDEYQYVLCKNI